MPAFGLEWLRLKFSGPERHAGVGLVFETVSIARDSEVRIVLGE